VLVVGENKNKIEETRGDSLEEETIERKAIERKAVEEAVI